jgi:hypothetical protein
MYLFAPSPSQGSAHTCHTRLICIVQGPSIERLHCYIDMSLYLHGYMATLDNDVRYMYSAGRSPDHKTRCVFDSVLRPRRAPPK